MLVLYHNDMSLCAQKVRVGLAEKGLEWESRHLVLRAGEHQQPWYLKLNRRAVVPTLIDGDQVVPESNVILEYLEEAFPDPSLAPRDAYGRAKIRLWTKQLDEDVHDSSAAILSFGIAFRHQWLADDHYSLADVAFTPYLTRLEHLNILGMVGERHRVADWYRRCQARPSFHDAIVKWENADYLALMKRRGAEAWPQVQDIMRTL
jgi:glutathione S-transferase